MDNQLQLISARLWPALFDLDTKSQSDTSLCDLLLAEFLPDFPKYLNQCGGDSLRPKEKPLRRHTEQSPQSPEDLYKISRLYQDRPPLNGRDRSLLLDEQPLLSQAKLNNITSAIFIDDTDRISSGS